MKERENKRQIIVRFVKYKKPNGTEGGNIGRSTITLVENAEEKIKDQEYWNDPKLWNKLRDWCLGKEGVKLGKATKTVTVNILVTDGEKE